MYNENNVKAGLGQVGNSLTATPRVAGVVENEIQGLQNATEQLSDTVNALCERLTPILRQPNPESNSGKDQVELSPLPQTIRVQKEGVLRNVFTIRNLLDRLEL